MKTIEKIEKEEIKNLSFKKAEVLSSADEIKKRWSDLYRAQALGNLLQSKVQIIFETTDEKTYRVDTTIWAVGQDFVSLKGGIHIPVSSIHEVS
ncbi:hypothetical protein ACFOUP_13240 [Belliella kenyensis]|uniref:Uncharacterized protein n=1 Tax=Belliella kenyensis TaxID=1472724 RepID=A0ABV8EPR2_9BACT|nr:hypothetical protein [Belliella kenyensis]MCH7403582.1 hypothetical protein [Belliella kenyensis]MDN3603866.1 hypothetical protein [Belliella kenyensis]